MRKYLIIKFDYLKKNRKTIKPTKNRDINKYKGFSLTTNTKVFPTHNCNLKSNTNCNWWVILQQQKSYMLPKRRLGRVKCDSTQSNTDVTKSSTVFVRTVLLYESNNGRTIAENCIKK